MDATALAHTDDPDTSHEAAAGVTGKDLVFAAITQIISSTLFPLTADDITGIYFREAEERGWPLVDSYSVKHRLSEMHKDGRVEVAGRGKARSGASASTWRLTHG